MCGRYALHSSPAVVALHFGLASLPAFAPRYNIAPAASAPVVKLEGAALASWGLRGSRHNARADSLAKPLYRRASRCLVPANGFFEWQRSGSLSQPYYVQPTTGAPFAFAGLWEDERFAIITTAASGAMAAIHDRMPAIIPAEHYAGWLQGEDGLPCVAADALRCDPVGMAVNHAANEGAALIAPLGSALQRGLFD
jgi:putative SOS response-associated peptidase YedK